MGRVRFGLGTRNVSYLAKSRWLLWIDSQQTKYFLGKGNI